MLIGCQRERGVEAGNEPGRTDTYQPRPAPSGELPPSTTPQAGTQPYGSSQEIRGELTRVDMANETFTVRVESGMEQTFKWNDQTNVQGLESETAQRQAPAGSQMLNLRGKEGSQVTVMWRDENGAKMASSVNVTQMSKSNSKSNTKGEKGTY
jgi:hypothetical protein